ncbi:uncharacterized protein [Clytia hemisphaerica]|uniref:Uncharacterized protein n=1 Tax=Clytia hemisphaerica TaxID=252671 RepID=A0A7M5WYH4_9CNID|eukprot:TCONS_00064554-protein
MKSPMYPTLEDVFTNGINDNINWIRIQKPFEFDSQQFQLGKLLYVPNKAFTKRRDSLTCYGFPDGNLHLLPYNIEGDFLSCEKNGEVAGNLFTLAIDEHNNVDVQISVTDKNANNNDVVKGLNDVTLMEEVGDFFRKSSSSSYEKNVENLLNSDEHSNNVSTNKYSPKLILRNSYPGNSKRRNAPAYENVTLTTANNEDGRTPTKPIPRPIKTVGSITTNAFDQIDALMEQGRDNAAELSKNHQNIHPIPMNNDKTKSLPATIHNGTLAIKPESCERDHKVLTLNNEKTFTSYFKKTDTHVTTKHPKFNRTPSKQFDKRFSIYGDRDYVQISMETFEKRATLHHQNSMNLTQEDYEDMTHPEVVIPQFFQPEEMFTVKLRTRAKSATLIRKKTKSPSLKAKTKERLSKSKSIADLDGDFSTEELKSLSDINPRKNKEMSSKMKKSKKQEGGDQKRRTTGKTITPYERLMVEVANFEDDEENFDLEEWDECRLSRRKGFNRFESRLVYHTIHGWQPRQNENDVGAKLTFAEDYSTQGLHVFLKDALGNESLAKYMKDYHVDGYLMKYIVMDDLILDDQMFDQSFLTIEELKRLRSAFYPNRLRCFAMDSDTAQELKSKTVQRL